MGIIRKTLSVTTLGFVGWKSKKELLAETEADLAAARADLEQTSAVRAALQCCHLAQPLQPVLGRNVGALERGGAEAVH